MRQGKFTDEQKYEIALELISGKFSQAEVCRKWSISSTYAYRLKDRALELLRQGMGRPAGRADAEAFIRRHHVTFPNLIGEPEAVAELYGELTGRPWFGTPTFLIYDPGGELRVQQVGAVPVKLIEEYIRSHSTRTPGRAGAPDGAPGAGLGAVSTSCAACQQFPTRIRGVLLCPPPPRVAMLRGVNREHAILEHRGAKYTGTTGTSL